MNHIVPKYLPVFVLFLVSLYICCLIKHKKHRKIEGYLFRGNGGFRSVASNIGTLFSITAFIVMGIGLGVSYGCAPFLIVVVLAGITTMLLGGKLIKSPEYQDTFFSTESFYERNFSIIDLADATLGKDTKVLCGAIVLVYSFMFLILECGLIRLCYDVIFPKSPLGSFLFIFVFMCVCFTYTFLGGFKGILITDVCQLAVIFIATTVILLCCPNIFGKVSTNFHRVYTLKITDFGLLRSFKLIGLFTYIICWIIASADFWVRTVCTLRKRGKKDCDLAKKTFYWSVPLMILCALTAVLVGILIRSCGLANQDLPSLVFSVLKYSVENLHTIWLKGCLLAALAAACLTTIDTFIIILTQTYFALGKNFQPKSGLLRVVGRLKVFRLNPYLFQTIAFFTAMCLSLGLTRENYFNFFVLFIHLLFFILTIIICSVYFKNFYTNNFGVTGMVLAIFIAYVIILYNLKFLTSNFELIVFVDAISLLAAYAIIAFYKKFYSSIIQPLLKKTLTIRRGR